MAPNDDSSTSSALNCHEYFVEYDTNMYLSGFISFPVIHMLPEDF